MAAASAVVAAVAPAAVDARDGRYRGQLVADNVVDSGVVAFDARRDGRRITGWRVTMNVTCASYPVRVELITQTMPAMKVRPDGRFRSVFRGPVDGMEARIVVTGRLERSRVVGGTIDYEVEFRTGTCRRTASWTAARGA